MMQFPSRVGRRSLLVAALVGGLILAGSVVVTAVARNGGLRLGPAYAAGTVLGLPGGSSTTVSVVGGNLEMVVETSVSVTSGSIVLNSDGFRRDLRARRGRMVSGLIPSPQLRMESNA
jgi:hypothetical protein